MLHGPLYNNLRAAIGTVSKESVKGLSNMIALTRGSRVSKKQKKPHTLLKAQS